MTDLVLKQCFQVVAQDNP